MQHFVSFLAEFINRGIVILLFCLLHSFSQRLLVLFGQTEFRSRELVKYQSLGDSICHTDSFCLCHRYHSFSDDPNEGNPKPYQVNYKIICKDKQYHGYDHLWHSTQLGSSHVLVKAAVKCKSCKAGNLSDKLRQTSVIEYLMEHFLSRVANLQHVTF